MIDCGSSGSRALIYSWKSYDGSDIPHGAQGSDLPVIEPGVKQPDSQEWQMKEEPGISTLATSPSLVGRHLEPLLQFANDLVPAHKRRKTPIYLLATAGMRLIPLAASQAILDNACRLSRWCI